MSHIPSHNTAAQLKYWQQQLSGTLPVLQLPADRPRPAVQAERSAVQTFVLAKELTDNLKILSKQERITLFITLLSAFQILLCRYSGQEDVIVGSPIVERDRTEIAPLINTLALRTNLAGNPPCGELFNRVRQVCLEAYAHRDLPFEQLVKLLQPERDLSYAPIFQVMFALQDNIIEELDLPNLTFPASERLNQSVKFDLTLSMQEQDGELIGVWEYNTDLFDASTIRRMTGHFQTLLSGIVANPDSRIGELPLLTAAEQQQLLVEWNQTQVDYSQGKCIQQLFEEQVEKIPAAIAVSFQGQQLTYEQLNVRANQLAHHLQKLGVGKEVLVGICVERCLETVVGILGILKAGGAYVPLDPAYANDRLHFMLEDAQVHVLLTQKHLAQQLPISEIRTVYLDTDWAEISTSSAENPVSQVTSDDLAYIIYTSGSTGKPKGVQVNHHSVVNLFETTRPLFKFGEGDVWTVFHSYAFDFSVWEIWGALANGCKLVVVPQQLTRSPQAFYELLCQEKVTILNQTPSAIRQLIPVKAEANNSTQKLSLRLLMCGGEALPADLAAELLEWNIPLWNFYGPTEATVWAAINPITSVDCQGSVMPIGRPLPNTQLYIVDANLQPVPIGVFGELLIGGVGLARGYLNRPELTAQRFIPNPFISQQLAKVYKTGDLARYLPNGDIEFFGRIDHQVKIRGFRIELGEIETVLSQHPTVLQTVVFPHENANQEKNLVAYVVLNPDNFENQKQGQEQLQNEQVEQWQMIYDQTYQQTASNVEATFNITGWNSSYTNQPIPPEHVSEWVNYQVAQILALQPNRVLEIGCGTGLLLFKIAPHSSQYVGIDFSAVSLNYIQQQLVKIQLPQVKLHQKIATDLAGIEAQHFDVVIINSVVQYFPSIEYLMQVIEGAIASMAPGGFIFIGDVRNLELLQAFHASVQLYQAEPAVTRAQLEQRVRMQMFQETELVIDPAFFRALKQHFPQISDVEIQLLRGHHHNELTQFRYNAILHIKSDLATEKNQAIISEKIFDDSSTEQPEKINKFTSLHWEENNLTVEKIRLLLGVERAEILAIANIPNARLTAAFETAALIFDAESLNSVSQMREAVKQRQNLGIEPEEFWALGEQLGYKVNITWSNPSIDGKYDVVFIRQDVTDKITIPGSSSDLRPWHTYATNPLQAKAARKVVPQLQKYLVEKLPDYMMPSAYVVLDSIPLSSNGKIDRRALPAPEPFNSQLAGSYIAPQTAIEETLVKIWSEVLGVKRVGIGDNFFELGGHSLSAMQIVVRIRDIYKVDLPMHELFTTPTIAELAKQIETELSQSRSDIPAIVPVPRNQHLPLSLAQEGLWLLMQLYPDNPFYNEPMTVRISEQVDVLALETALNEILRRHEAWRTTFSMVDGQPVQVIHPQLTLPLPVIDLQHLPPTEREPEALRLATAETKIPFDLTQPPLLRAMLVKLGEADYRLFLVLHHIIFDGISLHNIFFQELITLYKAFASNQPSPLPELTIQYADFAVWQRQWLQTVGANGHSPLQEKLAYWKQQLANLPTLQLPTDRPRSPIETFRGGRESLAFSKHLTEALKALSRKEGVSLYMLLLAAFKTVLCRYSGQDDIVVGTVTAGHNQPELEGLMGFFLNTLVLRTNLSGNPSFRELLQRVREVTLNAYAHQDLPFERLVAALRPDRRQSQHLLFQVAFSQDPPIAQVDPYWHLSYLDIHNGSSKFDLFLEVEEREEYICDHIEYNADLFDASTIRRLMEHLQTLLAAVVANPDQKISDIPLLTVAEQEQLQAWNNTQFSYAQDVCLHQLFEAQALKTPEALAVSFAGIGLTYRELDQKANQLAHHLQALGVKPEVLVGIAVERSLEMTIGILGILKAGGAYVPLDPAYPQERLAFMLADTQVPVLLTQQHLVATLPHCQAQIVCLDSDWEKIAYSSTEKINSGVSADNLAYVIYTSGSTGKPKGICLEQRPLLNLLAWHKDTLLTGVRTLQFASLSFDASFHEMFASWDSGGTLFLIPEALRRDTHALAQFIAKEKIEKVILPVVVLQQLAEIAVAQPGLLTSLREVTTTGEQLQINKSIIKLFKSLPQCRFHNHYGPSETHVVTALTLDENPDTWPTYPSIGTPITNTQIYLLDSGLKPVPVGVTGELYIGGDSLARGYLNRPDLTAQRFIPNPLLNQQGTGNSHKSARIYKTGDLARYLADGKIEYFGRGDQQVKIRGFRIELGEIEAALLQHQEVREGVVVLREDTPGDKRLVAYVVSNLIPDRVPYESKCLVEIDAERTVELRTEDISNGGVCLIGAPTAWERGKRLSLRLVLPVTSEELWLDGIVAWSQEHRTGIQLVITPTEQKLLHQTIEYLLDKQGVLKLLQRTLSGNLRRFLKDKLPDYMMPSSFVMLNTLPLTPNGKVDRRALPAPEQTRSALEAEFVAPRTPVEETLVKIWSEVLGLKQIGVRDHFFELGGHSLLATQVMSRLRDRYKLDLPLRCLFEAPTVAKLAEVVDAARTQAPQLLLPLQPVPRHQDLPLSFAQQRLWFLDQLLPGNAFYTFPQTFHLDGQLNVAVLEQSLNEIIRRHEVLRTTFAIANGQPVQIVAPEVKVFIPIVNLQTLPESEQAVEITKLTEAELKRSFNLSHGPLFRATLLQLAAEKYLLLLNIHHIVFDGWSASIFLRELTAIYAAFSSSNISPLPELPIQYADFTVWQRQWMQQQGVADQLSYWQQQLAELPILQLPTDYPRPAMQSYRGTRQPFVLSKDLTQQLHQLSQQEGVTLFMTLLAAFQTLLSRYTGSEDIPVGSLIANRNHSEIEGLIGFFVNTLVLRTDLSDSPSFRQLLERVREVTLGAYAHQDLPFEKLVEELEPERDLSRHPLFQVCFALQNIPVQALELPGVSLKHQVIGNGGSKFDLFLELFETPDGISGAFEYSTDLFAAATIARMGEHLQTLLTGIVANPDQKVSELAILTPPEQQQLLVDWNHTQVDYPLHLFIHQMFEVQVERTPDAVAVEFESEQLTYRELNAKANQLAYHLKTLGVGSDVLVAICVERSLYMLVGLLAILKAGGAYVPVDPAYPQHRVALMLTDAQVSVLLTQQHLLSQLPEHQARVFCIDTDWQDVVAQPQINLATSNSSEDLAYVIYTSGSTGKPKGVQLTHRSVVNFLHFMADYLEITAKDVLLSVTTLSFDIAVLELFLPITVGASIVLVSRDATLDGIQLSAKLNDCGATFMQATPATWRLLLESGWQGCLQLKILCGGEALPKPLAEQLLQRCACLWNVYGPTETTIWSATYKVVSSEHSLVPIGRPMANTTFYILDRHLQPVPVGVPGELYIGGAGLARGYLNRADLTSDRFIPNPFINQQGTGNSYQSPKLYKTGDLVRYLPDGNIEYLSRIDHQIKIRGFRIELGEVESVIMQHPAVQTGVVVDREDVPGQKRLVAYVVQNTQQDSANEQVAQWQTEHLSQWQTIYNQTYKQTTAEQSLTFNTLGWNSSYTGLPIPQAEMREWVENTVGRILSLHPKNVLEIGCGTGLLLSRVIPHCHKYYATDFAPEALRQIGKLQLSQPEWPQLTLLQRTADNFEGIEKEAFDTVIINSVVQYFPSINYLLRVLAGAVQAVQPGGSIFIGDVRSLPLQEAYHTSVALYQAPASLSVEQLQERIKQGIRQEEELVIHPAFFTALKQHLPKLSHVQIQFKRGHYQNELTCFRYDVTLYVGNKTYPTVEIPWLDWQKQKLTLPFIQQLLVMTEPEVLVVRNVPDARVIKEIKTIELLNHPDAVKTVAEIHSVLDQLANVGVDPEELWTLTQDLPYWLDIIWTDSSINGCFEVVFRRHSATEAEVSKQVAACFKETSRLQPWHYYANQPLQGKFARNIASELRRFIQDKLPEYMLPAAFVCLEKLPLTPNGKVDRKALPVPDQIRPTLEAALLKPRTPIEAEMVGIWTKVLGIDNLGIKDNFFELGGNSLLAAQLMMYVRETFQIQLPVKHIFEQPTVEGLSQAIAQLGQETVSKTTEIDFLAEAVLDPEIYPQQGFNPESIANPQHIFLTGSTGYLGAFLLYEFLQQTQAKVYCLVRAKNESEGLARVKNNLEKYLLWNSAYSDRIIPILGDLDQPLLGISPENFENLANQIDVIYHSGAGVNFVKPYSVLKAANVYGTQEVLRLACRGKLKPVHHISTIAIFGNEPGSNVNVFREDDNIDNSLPYLKGALGYAQSKWVSEKLVWIAKSRGIPVTVTRTGFAMGDSRTGATNKNDYISRMIKGCIMLGCFPDLGNYKEEFITVDYISRAVLHLSRKKASIGKAFHMVPGVENNFTMNQLFELVSSYGYQLQKVPFSQWLDQLISDTKHSPNHPLLSLLPMFSENKLDTGELTENPPVLDCQNTVEGLTDSSISCHPMNAELFNKYISYFTRSGFIEFPFCKLSSMSAG